MSMIMALNNFEFLYHNPLDKDDDGDDYKDDYDDNNLKGRNLIEGEKAMPEGIEEKTKEYETKRVQRKQAIAFTNDLPHGGREKKSEKEVYCLFAYIVSNSGDF